jgi:hypothetical protein
MTDDSDLELVLPPEEDRLAEHLASQRPFPTPGFRGTLGRHLAAIDPGYGPRPDRFSIMVSAYLGTGALFIALGALQAMGAL